MKILLIKSSSMGDIIHTFPAITDAIRSIEDITIDWVVEDNFAEIPLWHPGINNIIVVAIRKWRKAIMKHYKNGDYKSFIACLKNKKYDAIIDAQGLIKSACIASIAKGPRHGYSYMAAKEGIASLFYNQKHYVSWKLHAVERIRHLFAKALNYQLPETTGDFAISGQQFEHAIKPARPYIIFFHGTTWKTKHWPEIYWCQLAKLLENKNIDIYIPYINLIEKQRANKIAKYSKRVKLLDAMSITQMASVVSLAKAVVAVDTGLGHLSAAFNIPCISLYNVTDPSIIGAYGNNQVHLTSSCYSAKYSLHNPLQKFYNLTPQIVFERLKTILNC